MSMPIQRTLATGLVAACTLATALMLHPANATAQDACTTATDLAEMIECLRRNDPHAARCGSAQQERVTLPAGPRVLEFGQKTQFGTQSKGIAIEPEPGAAVLAPISGSVLFAGEWRSYGVLIIVAGCPVDALLAGAYSLSVTAGSLVKAGDPIARMSDKSGAIIYFEARSGGKAVDPRPYLQGQ
jgi:septal ring factor EnvC (AmiA/AmiB activator)